MSLDWIDDELSQLSSSHLLRRRVARQGKLGAKIEVDGEAFVNFGSNDYLGIASDEQLTEAVADAIAKNGWGSGASPLILGRHALHDELERQLAHFMRAEATLLFPTGFAANVGTIPALVGRGDVVFSDAKNHASIIDGCRLAGATTKVYPHNDIDALSEMLRSAKTYPKRLIVSDGLFSMDGDTAHVDKLVALASQHDAMLMIDEAHSLGVQGNDGVGICSEQGVAHEVAIRVGTLSKSFGSHGGFIAGSRRLIDYLANRARSYVFSTAAPVASSVAALAALEIIREQPERRLRLLASANRLREKLAIQGWAASDNGTHIVPVVVGNPQEAFEIAERLKQHGIWVPCIRPPSVPTGESLLRISLSSAHTDCMIDELITRFAECRRKKNEEADKP